MRWSIGFEQPIFLLLGPLILWGGYLILRRFRSFLALDIPLGPPGGIAFKPPVNLGALIRILQVLDWAGILLLWAAAAGPCLVYTGTVWLSRGADIIFVLDISPSMAALDMNGRSRFDEARDILKDFAARHPSDALGLVAVGNDAALLLPCTTDRRVFDERLDALQIGELGDGTALGQGLAIAARHLEGSTGSSRRAVVLITDGENNAGAIHPETAAALLPRLGSSFWVIGVGSGGEVPFTYVDPRTKMRRTGTLNSRYDPQVLKDLAEKGEGTWLPAASGDAFASAFARIDQGEMTQVRSAPVRREEPLQHLFILPAFILIGLVWFVRHYLLGALL